MGVTSNRKAGRWPLIISATLFTVFIIAVLAGKASTLFDGAPRLYLGDVPEFLILFASMIAFVICVLNREAARDGSSS